MAKGVLYCNCCGKKIEIRQGICMEDVIVIKHDWGYFSNKDGERHRFCLCESCYDAIEKQFKRPARKEKMAE